MARGPSLWPVWPNNTPLTALITVVGTVVIAIAFGPDFYQSIKDNNLFEPGPNWCQKPVPGANLKLIATFTGDDPSKATAIVQNIATGKQKKFRIGERVGVYRVADIQAKRILLQKKGHPAFWKRIH